MGKGGKVNVLIPSEVLEDLYTNQKLPLSKIAERYNCSLNTVALKLRKYKIKVRSLSEANKLASENKLRLIIPKEEVKDLFLNKKLSINKLTKYYNCSNSTIRDCLFRYNITKRIANWKKIDINKNDLMDLYLKQKLTTYEIAEEYGCCPATIRKKLVKFNIKRRKNHELYSKIPSKKLLVNLYLKKSLSTWEIEKRYGYCRSTVHRKLRKYGIKLRTLAKANTKYKKRDFSGNLLEKAYLIGLRLGDLRARKIWNNSKIIHVDCGSTKQEQIELIESLFKKYGRIWISRPNKEGKTQIECYLNLSFDFLLNKDIPFNLVKNRRHFYAFLAGFSDAECNIGINNNKAVYQIGNYNKNILLFIKNKLNNLNINSVGLYKDIRKGKLNSWGYRYNQDYWHLSITKKSELLKILKNLKPYIKHKQKIRDLNSAVANVLKRNRKFGE